ncbi:hypothetical protein VNI00_019042 [Paramarasmius palmivorus]|uniref:DUF3291 domain-containing protein n=1 Tax=Paramarasmius palmivorus TaxID=297713 RepID=A0AAW0ATC1_9AGAR
MKLSILLVSLFTSVFAQDLPPPAIPSYDPAYPRVCSEPILTQKLSVQLFCLRQPSYAGYTKLKHAMSVAKFKAVGNITHAFVSRYESDPKSVAQLFLWDETFANPLNTTFAPFSVPLAPFNQSTVLITNRTALWYGVHAPVTRILVGTGFANADYKGLTNRWANTLGAGAAGHWGSAWGTPLVGLDQNEPERRLVMISGWESVEAYNDFIAGLGDEKRSLYEQWKASLANPKPEWLQLSQTP